MAARPGRIAALLGQLTEGRPRTAAKPRVVR